MVRYAKISGIVALFILAAAIAIPNLLSTPYVKERIAQQLSDLTGRSVSLNGSSSVSLSPYLGVSYNDVTISDSRDGKGKTLVSMEEFKARLDLFPALWGDAQLTELEFIRPQFNLRVDANGVKNWLPDTGLLGAALSVNDDATSDTLDLGTIKIVDGKLLYTNEQKRLSDSLSAINGELNWANASSSADASFSVVWRGEITKISASANRFGELLRGRETVVTLAISAQPLSLSFDGKASSNAAEASGKLTIASNSPNRLIQWLDLKTTALDRLDATSVAGDMVLKDNSMEFPEAIVVSGAQNGRGRLQFSRPENNMLALSGTLAFDTLDLPNFQNLVVPATGNSNEEKALDLSFLEGVKVDLRLSAQEARSGSLELTNLAAAVLVRDNKASFDIGQAEALAGTIAGSIAMNKESQGVSLAADFSLQSIDLATLTKTYLGTGFSLNGVGNSTFKLKSNAATVDGLVPRLNGEGSLTASDGTLLGVDVADIFETVSGGTDSVVRISDASTNYSSLKVGFFIANGTAFFRDGRLENDAVTMNVSGRSDLVRRSLAIRGTISPTQSEDDPDKSLPFFIGGIADAPLFVPLPKPNNTNESDAADEQTSGNQ